MVAANAINATTAGLVKHDGVGNFVGVTTTNHALQVGAASNGLTSVALTNGQIPIGSTGLDPVAASLTQPSAGLTITGGAGTITFALANDLAAVEGLASNGLAARTATSTWTTRTITGTTDQITVTNGDGIAGNPTLSFPSTFFAQGTFTPTVEGTSTAGTGTYSVQVGRYQRIGRQVWVFIRVVWTAHDGTGNMRIPSLPFNTSTATNETQVLNFRTAVTTATPFTNAFVWGSLFGNSPNVQPTSFNNAAGTVASQAITATGELIFQGMYEI
jgi:hypothetical protein